MLHTSRCIFCSSCFLFSSASFFYNNSNNKTRIRTKTRENKELVFWRSQKYNIYPIGLSYNNYFLMLHTSCCIFCSSCFLFSSASFCYNNRNNNKTRIRTKPEKTKNYSFDGHKNTTFIPYYTYNALQFTIIIEKKLQFSTLLTAIAHCFTHRKQQIKVRAPCQNINVLLSNITLIFCCFRCVKQCAIAVNRVMNWSFFYYICCFSFHFISFHFHFIYLQTT